MNGLCLRNALLCLLACCASAHADTFTYVDEQQQTQTLEGRLVASGHGVHVLERADGRYVLVPEARLQSRVAGEDPAPISVDDMVEVLTDQFGEDRIRVMTRGSYIVGLVMAGPLPPESQPKVNRFLHKAARFMTGVERAFTHFCGELLLDVERPTFPLVMLVFETDQDFNEHAQQVTGGQGPIAKKLSGYYSPLSNWLAIRIGETRTYQVPLHEAIHQQVYNRGLLKRLAGVPLWFNEGIATGFENDGVRIDIGPTKINTTYARKVSEAKTLDWHDVLVDDSLFTGDVLTDEAYVHAWSLHWLLVINHRREYARYFRHLGQIEPLTTQSAAEREIQFRHVFGQPVESLEEDFPRLLRAQLSRENVNLEETGDARNIAFEDCSEVELTAVKQAGDRGLIEVRGTLKNISPFRDLAYYVTVQTEGGLYAQWHLPEVKSLSERRLNERLVEKPIDGGPGESGRRYWVEVTCALPDSPEAEQWRRGEFPVPTWEEPSG